MATNLKTDEQAQNDLNITLHNAPWYQAFLTSNGQNPNQVKLNGSQRKQLQDLAAQNGVVLPKGVQFDPSGNVNEQHGFAGQPGWAKALEIGAAAAAGGYFAAPALLGAGAAAPATAGAVDLSGVALPAAVGAGGLSTAAGAAGGLSTLGTIGGLLKKNAGTLSDIGGAVGAATAESRQRQLTNEERDRAAAGLNVSGESAYQSELQNAALTEAAQREAARKNLYRSSVAKNPSVSPYNAKGVPALSPEMLAGMSDLEKEALARLSKPTTYDQATMRAPKPYTPYVPNTQNSTMQTIGNWLSPSLSTLGMLGKVF